MKDMVGIAHAERDGTRAETRFRLSPKRTSPFKSVGSSVQSTTGSRGVRIGSSNGSNAGQTTFRGRVDLYWLPIPFACFPFTSPPCVTVCHQVPNELYSKYHLPKGRNVAYHPGASCPQWGNDKIIRKATNYLLRRVKYAQSMAGVIFNGTQCI